MAQRGVTIDELPEISLSDITDDDKLVIVDQSNPSITKSASILDLRKVFGEGNVSFNTDDSLTIDRNEHPNVVKVNKEIIASKDYVNNKIDAINEKISDDASNTNKLVTKNYVDRLVSEHDADFIGSYDNWSSVPIDVSELTKVPDKNDFIVILNASDYDSDPKYKGTWIFLYSVESSEYAKSNWKPEYRVSETPFTKEQWDAINSGIDSTKVEQIETNKNKITNLTNDLNNKVTKNTDITGSTKCKITYDSKGLVTSGSDLSESDIPKLSQSKITNLTEDLDNKIENIKVNGVDGTVTDAVASVEIDTLISKDNNVYGKYLNINDFIEFESNPYKIYSLSNHDGIYLLGREFAKGILISNDGITWTDSGVSYSSGTVDSIIYGKDRFIIGSTGSGIFYSFDGLNWVRTDITSGRIRSLCYGNNIYLAGSGSGNGLYVSNTGTTWVKLVDSTDNYRSIAYGDSKFVVAIYNKGLYYSDDISYSGTTWNSTWNPTSISTGNFGALTYGKGIFIAVGFDSSTTGIYYSLDGINWNLSDKVDGIWYSVEYSNGIFVAGSGSNNGIWKSVDGIHWVSTNIVSGNWRSITCDSEKFIVGSFDNGNLCRANIELSNKSLSTEEYVNNKVSEISDLISIDNDTLVKNPSDQISVNSDRVDLLDIEQTITEHKTFNKSVKLSGDSVPTVIDPIPVIDYVLPSSMDPLPSSIEIPSGSYELTENRTSLVIITSGTVNLYIPSGKCIRVNGNNVIKILAGATLNLYNEGELICETDTSSGNAGISSVIINNGTCYLYGIGSYINSGSKHWYQIVNHGDYMEINGGNFIYDKDCTSSMCINGYANVATSGELNTYVSGVNSRHPTLVINSGSFNLNHHANHSTFKNDAYGIATINNGEFYNNGTTSGGVTSDRLVKSCGDKLTINGGHFHSTGLTSILIGTDDTNTNDVIPEFELGGGIFTTDTALITISFPCKDPIIKAGKFKNNFRVVDIHNVDYKSLPEFIGKEYMYDYTTDGYLVIDSVDNFARDWYGLKLNNSAIIRTSTGLVGLGVRVINSDKSIVNKEYVDNKVHEIPDEYRSIISSLSTLNESSSEYVTKLTVNKLISLFKGIYLNIPVPKVNTFSESEKLIASNLDTHMDVSTDLDQFSEVLSESTSIFKSMVFRGFDFSEDDLIELEKLHDYTGEESLEDFVNDINVIIDVLNHATRYPAFYVSWSTIDKLDISSIDYPDVVEKLNEVNSYLKEGVI